MDTDQSAPPPPPSPEDLATQAEARAKHKEEFLKVIVQECTEIKSIAKEIDDGNSQGLVAMALILLTIRGAANQILGMLQRVLMMLQAILNPPMPPQA